MDGYGIVGFNLTAGSIGTVMIDTSAGTVSTTANGGLGIYAQSLLGAVSVTSAEISIAGNSIPAGTQVNGVFATTGGTNASGAVTVDTSAGSVSLTGTTTSHAISASSTNGAGGGAVTVTTGSVSTVSANADGINAVTTGTGANGLVMIDTTAGTISTQGTSARAISATSTNGAINIDALDISTQGNSALGIFASGPGGVSITATDIGTLGTSAHAIQATSTGTVTIDTTAGTLTTANTSARGISIDKTGSTAITIDAGSISTTGANSQGIHIFSGTSGSANGGAVSITANSISTTGNSSPVILGDGADAIYVITTGANANGKVTIDTSVGALPNTLGSVMTEGTGSRGIRVESGRSGLGGGAIEITAGNVSTLGDSAAAIDAPELSAAASTARLLSTRSARSRLRATGPRVRTAARQEASTRSASAAGR